MSSKYYDIKDMAENRDKINIKDITDNPKVVYRLAYHLLNKLGMLPDDLKYLDEKMCDIHNDIAIDDLHE